MDQEIVDATGVPVHDEDVERDLRHAEEEGINGERAERFYDRVRTSIQQYLEKKGRAVEKTAEFLLLVPDVFILLWRLTTDGRVSGKNKMLLGSGIAYYILPFDLIPEAIVGPMSFVFHHARYYAKLTAFDAKAEAALPVVARSLKEKMK